MPKLPKIARIEFQRRKQLVKPQKSYCQEVSGFAFQLSLFGNFGISGNRVLNQRSLS